MKTYGDYITSIEKAFDEIDDNWRIYDGIVIGGTHKPNVENTENLIPIIKNARENGIPLYAECHGYQLVCVEYARNTLGIKDATSEEWGKGTFVVKKRRDGLNVGLKEGESYWNNYEVDLPNWKIPNNFFIAQYHASYQSSLIKKHPLIVKFLQYARDYTRSH